MFGGERGIRTLDTLLTYTRFPSVRLQPLGHLSDKILYPFPTDVGELSTQIVYWI